MSSHASGCEERSMIFDYALGGIVTLAIMIYLVFALINPERF
jgi:K+-transporting ATPase KdpF subunit